MDTYSVVKSATATVFHPLQLREAPWDSSGARSRLGPVRTVQGLAPWLRW